MGWKSLSSRTSSVPGSAIPRGPRRCPAHRRSCGTSGPGCPVWARPFYLRRLRLFRLGRIAALRRRTANQHEAAKKRPDRPVSIYANCTAPLVKILRCPAGSQRAARRNGRPGTNGYTVRHHHGRPCRLLRNGSRHWA